jgi:hypothetical protein
VFGHQVIEENATDLCCSGAGQGSRLGLPVIDEGRQDMGLDRDHKAFGHEFAPGG